MYEVNQNLFILKAIQNSIKNIVPISSTSQDFEKEFGKIIFIQI